MSALEWHDAADSPPSYLECFVLNGDSPEPMVAIAWWDPKDGGKWVDQASVFLAVKAWAEVPLPPAPVRKWVTP